MIHFRFHLVSLVAVFLALALGVVMGSTVIDRAIVDGLRARIDNVEKRADERRKENLELKSRLDALEAYTEQAMPHLVGGRLDNVSMVVVAVEGVDDEAVRETVLTLQLSGVLLPGVMWIESSLALSDDATEVKLSGVLGDPSLRGDDARRQAIEALGQRLAYGSSPAPGTTPVSEGAEDLLLELESAGFLRFEAIPGEDVDLAAWPQPGSRMLVIDGSEGKVDSGIAAIPLVRFLATAGVSVALAEVFHPGGEGHSRGDLVAAVRNDQSLANKVATVDDLEELRGRVAVALAVQELGQGRAGHYGEGPGATRQLPEPKGLIAGGVAPS